jgi:tetratricopeptide (TPR) repeat protein
VIQRDLIERSERLLGWDNVTTREIAGNLVTIYQEQHKQNEAKALATNLLSHQEKIPEISTSEALMTRLKLARISHSQGRYQEAEEIRRSVLDHRTELDDYHLAETLSSYAESLLVLGKTGDSRKALVEALRIFESSLGAKHVMTLGCKEDLAEVYLSEGAFEDAIGLGYDVLKIRKKCLGEVHPSTIGIRSDLAVYLARASRFEESKMEISRALELSRSHLGDENAQTIRIVVNAASLYMAMNLWPAAEELAYVGMISSRRINGEDHPETLTAIFEHARCRLHNGECREAVEVMRLCVSRTQRKYGDSGLLTSRRAELAVVEKLYTSRDTDLN